MVSLFKHWRTTYERVDKFLSDTYFTDVNLYGKIISDTEVISEIYHFNEVTKPHHSSKDNFQLRDDSALSFSGISTAPSNQWTGIDTSTFSFGPTWSIHWFKLSFHIPNRWLTIPNTRVELQWNSDCEVMVYSSTGLIVKGLNSVHSRISVPISSLPPSNDLGVEEAQYCQVYLQTSCSDLFGAGDNGTIRPPSTDKVFKISKAQLALVSIPAVDLYLDLKILLQIAEALKETSRGHEALYSANEAINSIVDLRSGDIVDKMGRAQDIVDKFFNVRNGGSVSTLHAMGHCHIDTAWLWRYGETRRKTARSWSTTLRLLEAHPNMTFVCSQAQQLAWLKEDYPSLFDQLQHLAAKKQFLPVGGTWVEMDVNMPCCESLCRQFLYGQRFFRDNFGTYCKEFWLPDTFGYSPQLPQIMRQANITRFMTQKLSWSLVNKFPNHTFWWRGIDGTRVLAHFPPGDSYCMSGKVSEMLHSVNNFADKGRSSSMMYLYGYGDGGQGPTEEMVHVIDRLADCDGLPRIVHSSPEQFFSTVEDKDGENLCTWSGELFLELHNGTYTSQRQIKKGNSHCEQLLRVVELMVCLVMCGSILDKGDGTKDIVSGIKDALESHWKVLLLNQFHDVLPGSSIEHVCDDAYWAFQSIKHFCCTAIKDLGTLLTQSPRFFINPTSWPLLVSVGNQKEVICIPPLTVCGGGSSEPSFPDVGYLFDADSNQHKVSNQYLEILVDDQCRISSLKMTSVPELGNVLSGPGNELFLYDDVPLYWDAWDVMDYHLETGVAISSVASYHLMEKAYVTIEPGHVKLSCFIKLENTGTIIEKSVSVYPHLDYVQLNIKVIRWQESHKLLKVGVPTVANANELHCHTQAGYINRPSHRNTSWDSAKYEVCSHDWIYVCEANWGVALLKDSIFGCSSLSGEMYLSLLRSPTSPDNTADKKHLPHLFSYGIYPFHDSQQSSRVGAISKTSAQFCWLSTLAETNLVINEVPGQPPSSISHSFPLHLVSPISGEVSLDWIKPGCYGGDRFILRLHEQVGGRYEVRIKSRAPIIEASITNILEETIQTNEQGFRFSTDEIEVNVSPFKIVSISVLFGH